MIVDIIATLWGWTRRKPNMDSKEPRKLKEGFLVKKVRMLPNKSYQTPLTKKNKD